MVSPRKGTGLGVASHGVPVRFRSSDSARFVAASLTLIIRVVMVRFGLDAVITVGLVFYIFT